MTQGRRNRYANGYTGDAIIGWGCDEVLLSGRPLPISPGRPLRYTLRPLNPAKGMRMHFDHVQYLPIAPPLFALLAGALVLLLILVQIRVLRYAYMQLGVSSGTAFFLLFASLLGSYVNIPIAVLGEEVMVTEREVTFFGMHYRAGAGRTARGHPRGECRRRGYSGLCSRSISCRRTGFVDAA